jgi:hypothetical protein
MKLKTLFKKVLYAFPSPVPQGGTEFEKWAQSIIDVYQPPMEKRSVRFALCAMLMRLDPTEAYKSKRFFALCLHKGAAAQVAAYKMEEIKFEQAEEEKRKQAEAEENSGIQEVV